MNFWKEWPTVRLCCCFQPSYLFKSLRALAIVFIVTGLRLVRRTDAGAAAAIWPKDSAFLYLTSLATLVTRAKAEVMAND